MVIHSRTGSDYPGSKMFDIFIYIYFKSITKICLILHYFSDIPSFSSTTTCKYFTETIINALTIFRKLMLDLRAGSTHTFLHLLPSFIWNGETTNIRNCFVLSVITLNQNKGIFYSRLILL